MNIYKITNNITGKSYIGKDTKDLEYYMGSGNILWESYRKRFGNPNLSPKRKSDHKWVFEQNKIKQIYTKKIIELCDDKQLLSQLEILNIIKHDTIRPFGYNIAAGGEGGYLVAGYNDEEMELWREKISQKTKEAMCRPDVREKLLASVQNKSEEWILHISESLKGHPGHPMSEEQKQLTRERMLGNKYGIGNKSRTGYHNSPEMNQHISEGAKKVIHTPEWNQKVGAALKGRPRSEETKEKLRKPKPKYKWLLPDGSIRVMDVGNASKHHDWVRLD